MKSHRNFFNFLTETMAQPLYKIPISWWFCIYSLERLILHPQYHHTSFLEPFLTIKEDRPISYFWRKSYVNPFTKKKKPLWPLCKHDVFVASRGLFSHRIMYMYITKHDFKAYFVKKWRMRKFSFFFFFNQNHLFPKLRYGNFAKTIHSLKKIVLYKE